MNVYKMRVARPTRNLEQVVRFYREGLGLEHLGGFEDHEGFDGVMLGEKGAPYHLEFTVERGHEAPRSPSEDNLLVFYLPERAEWEQRVRRMEQSGFPPVRSRNPYWDAKGKTFEDPDGYRVVLYQGEWTR
ncbi:prolyl endopeptidase [Myxococcus stipitatus DSM 14675]|uniref:Prolyl endopeptidase n=1 Tax=Myxococcus stipitatus (strain DSM 14675 / JCM 12634 / Mx s8) TaxID=1278073 RepID=L7UNB6_MYXSD|nr:VOC family protein [Myxococcus stipitatus]AGC49385.1 prolyl endopeptidase [Myxococcus stipitatus DSM 14675]